MHGLILRSCLAFLVLISFTTGCNSLNFKAVTQPKGDYSTIQSPTLHANFKIPNGWPIRRRRTTPIYSYGLWVNPNDTAGVGVVYITLPVPISTDLLVGLFKMHYAGTGKITNDWIDAEGRHWFRGEDPDYIVEAFTIIKGSRSWVIFCGCTTGHDLNHYKSLISSINVQ